MTWLVRLGYAAQVQLAVLVLVSAVLIAADSSQAIMVQRAEVAAANLVAGMADQQTGLLTYLKVVQPDSLVLYAEGEARTEAALSAIRADTGGTTDAPAAAQVEAAVQRWQAWADTLHAQQRPVTDPIDVAEGQHLFGQFTAVFNQLDLDLEAESRLAGERIVRSTVVSLSAIAVDSLIVAVGAGLFSLQVVREVLTPLRGLVTAAARVAAEGLALIPYRAREDEIGDLARALQGWQETSAVRSILAERAPVGICRIDAEGRFLVANAALERILDQRREDLEGRPFSTFLHPDDRDDVLRRLEAGARGGAIFRDPGSRWLRGDGSVVWCSMITAPVPGSAGRTETLVGIMEDVTERKRQAERAAEIQRVLLPTERPVLDGYEVAAACRPARDVTGDFYDWIGPEGGHLDLTVADTARGGPGAALVMATVRMALRTMPRGLEPGARVALVAESISRSMPDDATAILLFHARLDLAASTLRYVDAGLGWTAIRRASGALEPLAGRRRSLAAAGDGPMLEGRARLEPGDALVVSTDGLLTAAGGMPALVAALSALDPGASAGELIAGVTEGVQGRPEDDVTVLVLRRAVPPSDG